MAEEQLEHGRQHTQNKNFLLVKIPAGKLTKTAG